jgi:hypothetical protein
MHGIAFAQISAITGLDQDQKPEAPAATRAIED